MNGKMYNKILSTVGVICILLLLMLGFYNAIKDYNSLVEHGEYTIGKTQNFSKRIDQIETSKDYYVIYSKTNPKLSYMLFGITDSVNHEEKEISRSIIDDKKYISWWKVSAGEIVK